MTDFLLVPGAGGGAWYWHRLVAELTDRGHRAVAVELPADDPSAGLDRYVEVFAELALVLARAAFSALRVPRRRSGRSRCRP